MLAKRMCLHTKTGGQKASVYSVVSMAALVFIVVCIVHVHVHVLVYVHAQSYTCTCIFVHCVGLCVPSIH